MLDCPFTKFFLDDLFLSSKQINQTVLNLPHFGICPSPRTRCQALINSWKHHLFFNHLNKFYPKIIGVEENIKKLNYYLC